MKVIDLLNKIANREEVPQKIKVDNKIYNYETFNIGKGNNYFTAEWEEVKGYRINYDGTYYYLEIRDYNLNDEVEIIEEENKIPEKLKVKSRIVSSPETLSGMAYSEYYYSNVELGDKINEIIDYFKEKENK